MSFGKHPAPLTTLAHFTDTHLLAGGGLLGRSIDTDARLVESLDRLRETVRGQEAPLAALIVSGDITDLAEPEAYARALQLLDTAADELGAQLIVTPGNHDERPPMAEHLLGLEASEAPLDAVHDLGGLRVISLDSTLPGYHHGGFDRGQAEWLREQLRMPAPLGTVIVMHHPPVPYRTDVMRLLEFVDDDELADIVRDTDVRLILAGHLHVVGGGTCGGVPVSVAGAISYVDDLTVSPESMRGIDDAQAFSLVEVYAETITHWSVQSRAYEGTSPLPSSLLAKLASMPDDERREAFSRKPPA